MRGATKASSHLTARGQQFMSLGFNSIAFGNNRRCGSIGGLAEQLAATLGRLMPMVRKLTAQGYGHDRRPSAAQCLVRLSRRRGIRIPISLSAAQVQRLLAKSERSR